MNKRNGETDVDLRDVLQGIDAMGRVFEKYGEAIFTEVGVDVKADMREQKRAGSSVLGEVWAARAASTQERGKRAGKRKKSARTGLLGRIPTAWKAEADKHGVTLTNKVPFANAHHTGATVGHGATLPARPHQDLNPERIDDAVEALKERALDLWDGKK